jgi:hypothetical protein
LLGHARAALGRKILKRFWVISDLQQSDPLNSERCLRTAVADHRDLSLECDAIWYLGDAIERQDEEAIRTMCGIHLQYLQPLAVPVRYVMGNHEFDLYRSRVNEGSLQGPGEDFPFWNTVRSVPGWRTIESVDQFFFVEDIGEFLVVFFSDHGDPAGRWFTTHGEARGAADYPYGAEEYARVREMIAGSGKPVITASHYALAGGARPSALLNQLLPLPDTVRLHLHGHSHIGDQVWGGKDCYRKIACVDHQAIPQVNISSLENTRGNSIRSAYLEIYEDLSFGVWFRNHMKKRWEDAYLSGG